MKWCVLAQGPSRIEVIGPFDSAQIAADFVDSKFTAPAWANSMIACPMKSPDEFTPDGPKLEEIGTPLEGYKRLPQYTKTQLGDFVWNVIEKKWVPIPNEEVGYQVGTAYLAVIRKSD